jgi:hypothetical protein
MIHRLRQFGPALATLSLISAALIGAASAPAMADALSNDDYYVRDTYVTTTVRPGYGFNGAYQEMRREMAAQPTYVAPAYTYTPNGYVYSAPVTTYTYTYRPVTTYAPVAYAPALSKDQIEDRLDDQGYDDIKVGDFDNGFYNVFAEDRDDRKVVLKVDASSGYVSSVQYIGR